MTDSDSYDANEFVSTYIKKEELAAGAKRFSIDRVSKTIFEARNGRGAQTVLVLELDGSRKYSLSTKADLHTLIGAFGPQTAHWIGREITLAVDPTVMFGNDRVGGVRVRIPDVDAVAPPTADIEEAMPSA